jgi:hypothetical protein
VRSVSDSAPMWSGLPSLPAVHSRVSLVSLLTLSLMRADDWSAPVAVAAQEFASLLQTALAASDAPDALAVRSTFSLSSGFDSDLVCEGRYGTGAALATAAAAVTSVFCARSRAQHRHCACRSQGPRHSRCSRSLSADSTATPQAVGHARTRPWVRRAERGRNEIRV